MVVAQEKWGAPTFYDVHPAIPIIPQTGCAGNNLQLNDVNHDRSCHTEVAIENDTGAIRAMLKKETSVWLVE